MPLFGWRGRGSTAVRSSFSRLWTAVLAAMLLAPLARAALTDAEHNATLSNMTAIFADVMTTSEVVALVAASRLQGAA